MELRPRDRVLVAVAALLATVFVGLGLWQLDRLSRRRALNAERAARMERPPLRGLAPPRPPADSLLWRRVRLAGRIDYGRELVLRGRAFRGTPGVHVVAPLLLPDGTAVLVERGWLPAADALHAPLERGRPPDPGEGGAALRDTVEGLVLPGSEEPAALRSTPIGGARKLVADRLAPGDVADSLPYPLLPFYVRRLRGAGANAATELPAALDDGPHLGYAVQWFSFAAIALAGTGPFLWSERRG